MPAPSAARRPNAARPDPVALQKEWTAALKAGKWNEALLLCETALPLLSPKPCSLENILDDDHDDLLPPAKQTKLILGALLCKAQCLLSLGQCEAAQQMARDHLVLALVACTDKTVQQAAGKNARDLYWYRDGVDKIPSRGVALKLADAAKMAPRADEDKHLKSLAIACADPKLDRSMVLDVLEQIPKWIKGIESELSRKAVWFEFARALFTHGQREQGLQGMLESASSTAQCAHAARCASQVGDLHRSAEAWQTALLLWAEAGMASADPHGAASADQWARACVQLGTAELELRSLDALEAQVSALIRVKALGLARDALERAVSVCDVKGMCELRLLQARVERIDGNVQAAQAFLDLAEPLSKVDEQRIACWQAVLEAKALSFIAHHHAFWTATSTLAPRLVYDAQQLAAYHVLAGSEVVPTTAEVVSRNFASNGDLALVELEAQLKNPPRTSGDLSFLLSLTQTLLWLGDLWAMRGAPRQAVYYWERGLDLANKRGAIGARVRFEWLLALASIKAGKTRSSSYAPPSEGSVGLQELAWAHFARLEMDALLMPAPSFADAVLAKRLVRATDNQALLARLELIECMLERKLPPRELIDVFVKRQPDCDEYRARALLYTGDLSSHQDCTLDLQVLRDFYLANARTAIERDEPQVASVFAHAGVGLPSMWSKHRTAASSKGKEASSWMLGPEAATRHRAAARANLSEGVAVVSLSLSGDGLLISRTTREGDTCVLLPVAQLAQTLLDEFADLMEENVKTISGASGTATRRQEWWDARHRLDERMRDWLERASAEMLGWAACLLCPPLPLDASPDVLDKADHWLTALASRRARNGGGGRLDETLAAAVVHNASRFQDASVAREGVRHLLGEGRGADVEDLVVACRALPVSYGGGVVLCLGGRLGQLPWEAMLPEGMRISRMPSSALVLACPPAVAVQRRKEAQTLEQGLVVVDSRGDLPRTAEAMRPVVDQLREQGWVAFESARPGEEEAKALLASAKLLFFCGHGAGEDFLSRDAVRDVSNGGKHLPPALLMGCSSAKRDDGGGVFEPCGVVDAYCLGGSAAVVGNLWDVTDKDIDRFTLRLWELGALKPGADLPALIGAARGACKLRWLVGAAPVCYGVPSGTSTPA